MLLNAEVADTCSQVAKRDRYEICSPGVLGAGVAVVASPRVSSRAIRGKWKEIIAGCHFVRVQERPELATDSASEDAEFSAFGFVGSKRLTPKAALCQARQM